MRKFSLSTSNFLKFALLSMFVFAFYNKSNAQTLSAGDIAFVGYNTDDPDGFSFITLATIPANEVIYFTDQGWNSSNSSWYLNSEDHLIWTAPSGGVAAGTIITIVETSADVFTSTTGTMVIDASSIGFSLSAGDNVFAYQSSSGAAPASPSFIAGIYGDDNYAHTTGCDASNNWLDCANCTTSGVDCTTSSLSTSSLPSALTNGINAIALFPSPNTELDNAQYTGSLTGTASQILSYINNYTNWSFNDATPYNLSTGYSSINLTASCSMTASITSQTNVACNGNSTGSLTVTQSSGTSTFDYAWSNGSTTSSSASSTNTISSLTAGTYTVTITDNNACTATASATITQPAAFSASISSLTNVACNGAATGSLTVTKSGGISNFDYSWSNGSSTSNTSSTTNTITSLTAGTYTVTVTDANACTSTASATITQLSALTASISSQTNVACNGAATGSLTVSPSGGAGSYTYVWSNGATNATTNGLAAGTYTSTITDANGCTATASATITQPSAIVASASVSNTLDCNGDTDGQVTASASGGTSSYTYSWSTGGTSVTETSLGAGTYSVTITDANGCTDSASVTLTQPSALVASASVSSTLECNGDSDGQVTASQSGGTAGYTYSWNTGGTSATETFLTAGTYSITVTDNKGCTDSASVTLTEPSTLVAATVADSNVSCNGGSDGGATAFATGGTASYTYSWNNGATTSSITGVTAGTYSVTVTDNHGCTDSASVTVTEPTLLVASSNVTSNPTCGSNNGSITASASGGTPAYTYAWSTGGTSATETGLGAGTYSVTITDQHGCTDSASVTLTQPSSPIASASVTNTLDCNGYTDGQVTASASSGTSPYTYSWNTGGTSATETSLGAGTYSVTITDANGCTDSASVNLTEPTALVASASVSSTLDCNGDTDGQVTASASGGTAGYTYSWSTGGTSATETSLGAGTYSVTITDNHGCYDSASVTLTQPASLIASTVADSNISCNGGSDGGATASATGGTASYTYSWSNGATTASITGVAAGTYSVTITDNHGCTDSASVAVTEPTALSAFVSVDSNETCGFNNGGATASPTGGTAGYNYVWSNSATTASITGVAAGTYTVTITDAYGCTDSESATITNSPGVTASASVSNTLDCNGDTDGQVTASASGGSSPYTYSWSTGGTSATETGLGAGTYSVTITDQTGCTDSASITLTQPTALVASASVSSTLDCNGDTDGQVTASASGGSSPYTYSWSTGGTSATETGLGAGTYSVTITDNHGCYDSASVTLTEPSTLVASTVADSNVSCNGGSDGGATASATGGTASYTYSWSNGATTSSITGVAAGTYSVTITDNHGCTDSASISFTDPSLYLASIDQGDSAVFCGGDSVLLSSVSTASSYAWNMIDQGNWALVGTAGFSATSFSNLDLKFDNGGTPYVAHNIGNGLVSVEKYNGTNWVSVGASSFGIETTSSSSFAFDIDGNTPYVAYAGQLSGRLTVQKFDGTNWVTVGGSQFTSGTALYVDLKVISGVPYVTFRDDNNSSKASVMKFDGSNWVYVGTAGFSASNCALNKIEVYNDTVFVAYQDFSVSQKATVKKYNGSSWVTVGTVGFSPYPATDIDLEIDNGTPYIAFTNGYGVPTSAVMKYLNGSWSQVGTGSASASFANFMSLYAQNNELYIGYRDGSNSNKATVRKFNGSSWVDHVSAGFSAGAVQLTQLEVYNNVPYIAFQDGSNSGKATVMNLEPSLTQVGTSNTYYSQTAGTYVLEATSASGCVAYDTIVVSELLGLGITATLDSNVTCNGQSDGGATASVSTGTAPYTYSWSNSATTASVTGVTAGTYSVTITDANGCTDSASVTITEPAILTASTTADSNVSCNGGNDGGATASATGGTASYTYTWSNGATTASITGVAAGTYSVTITDNSGCTDSASVTITEPASLIASTVADSNISCNGGSDGGATASATGGTASYTYSWSNGATTASITGVAAGTYSVTITDNHGCTDSASVAVTEPAALLANGSLVSLVTCTGIDNGSATATPSGGTMPYTYAWSNGATTATISSLPEGNYSVTVTDANGCTATDIVPVEANTVVGTSTIADSNASCFGLSDGGATITATSGTTPYSYSWSNGATTSSISGLSAGGYAVTVTDIVGCIATDSVYITEPTQIVGSISLNANASCIGAADGSLTASATGGAGSFTYAWTTASTSSTASGLTAGTYSVTITDLNGCIDTVSHIITEPNSPISNFTLAPAFGAATPHTVFFTDASTLPNTWSWAFGDGGTSTAQNPIHTYTSFGVFTVNLTVTDTVNGCSSVHIDTVTVCGISATSTNTNVSCNGLSDGASTVSASNGTGSYTYLWSNAAITNSISGVTAGTYTVTITDAIGCTATETTTITEPALLVSTTSVDSNITCNGLSDGGATASATGGTSPYTYLWSNSATTASISGVTAGTYTVTVTDANGCTDSETATITEPAILVATTVADSNVSCNGGNDGGATASATGGTAAYTYTWSNGATTASITDVAAGTYVVTITDANGCTDNASISITEPTTLVSASLVDSTVSCNGYTDGGATASATGGTASYNYAWSNGTTTASITGVVAGTYSVTITDANGCADSSSVTITEPTTLIGSTVVDSNVTCNGLSTGGATASATGGTGAYTFLWSNAATTASITGVAAGTYTVTITDANGCTDAQSSTITEPALLVASTVVDSNITCNGLSDGGATASATGGTSPYTYAWSNSATTASITSVAAGTYTITITDLNGCTATDSATVTEPAVLVASTVVDSNVSCNSGSDGGATASATGGTTSYTYSWSNGATTASITGVASGTYTVTITDAQGCTDSASVTVTEPATLVASTSVTSNYNGQDISCNGFSDGELTASAVGGTAPYTYLWSTSATTAINGSIPSGTYTVTITDANGCTSSASGSLTEPTALSLSLLKLEDEECVGGNDGIIAATTSGGVTPYGYLWNNGVTSSTNSSATAGFSVITVTDLNGCVIIDSLEVFAVDTTAPTPISQNVTIYLDAFGMASVTTAMVNNGTYDNCVLDTVWLSQYDFGCPDSNNNTIWMYAQDTYGNVDSITATITVLDIIEPEIVCVSSISQNNDLGVCGAVITYTMPVATDNCTGIPNVIQIAGLASGTTFPIGTTTNTFVAIDSSGNSDTCSFDVTIIDNEAPSITCIADIIVNNDVDSCGAIVTFGQPAVSDNCTIDTTYQTAGFESGSLFPIGTTIVSFETVDSSGNMSSCSFNVIVTDAQAPVIVCQNDTAMCDPTFVFDLPAASDNCEVDTVFQIAGIESGDLYPVGTTTNTFVAIDIHGNSDTCSFNVTRDAEVAGVFAGLDETICDSTHHNLNADVPTIGAGVWTSLGTAQVTNTTSETSEITALVYSSNDFVWTVSNGTCPSVSDTVTITVDQLPTMPNAGDDYQLCAEYETEITANAITVGFGVWSALNGGTIDDTLSNTINISDLTLGDYAFVWSTDNGVCPTYTDTMMVFVDPLPVINAGEDQNVYSQVSVQLSASSDIPVEYTWTPSTYLNDPTIANPVSTPEDSIYYVVEGVSEVGCYGYDTVQIKLLFNGDVYTGFTPDGDGINETWTIEGIENYPNARVSVFNRWGAQVYEGGYDSPPFDGKYNGNLLPVGSYYYVIEFNDGITDPYDGTLTIIY